MGKGTGKARHPHDPNRPESAAVQRALLKGDMEALGLALTVRQRRFCEEYVVDFNGSAACVRAGYSKRYPDRQAHVLLQNEGIRTYCEHLARQTGEALTTIDKDYIVQQVLNVIGKENVRAGDQLRGYEFLAKLMGLLVDRTEITGKDGEAIQLEQKRLIEEESASFIANLKQLQDRVDKKKEIELV